jgi:hypothetical protein
MRWCTNLLKLVPFENYVGDDQVISYVGIRADENRSGYISTKHNIKPTFPFKEHGIDYQGVMKILGHCSGLHGESPATAVTGSLGGGPLTARPWSVRA